MTAALIEEHCPANDLPLEVPPLQEPEERAEFHVTDQKSAEWVLAKIANKKAQLARNKEWIQQEIARTESEIEHLLQRFGSELEQFAGAELEDGKKKSLSLPSGTIGFRKQPAHLEVQEEARTLEWARQHLPLAVKCALKVPTLTAPQDDVLQNCVNELAAHGIAAEVVTTLGKAEVNAHFNAAGEIPDGCCVVDEKEKFFVK